MKTDYIFELEMKVRDYECDLQGIVNNANYQHYIEHTRHEFLLAQGISFADLHTQGIDAVVARLNMAFKTPLKSGDRFVSKLRVEKEGIKYVFYQDIFRLPDMKCCLKSQVDTVCLIEGRLGTCRELWSSAEQQQNYLPGVPEGSDLCLTPVSAPENHYVRIKANNRLDAKGTLTGQFTITAEGQSDSNIRRIFTTGWQSQWQAALESQLLAVSPKARLISVDYGKDPKNYQAAPIKMTFRYEIPGYALSGEREMLFKPMVMNNLYNQVKSYLRINTDLEERRYGFKDACSRLVELDETIQLPTGYKLAGNGKEDSVQSSAADFEGSLRQDGNKVVLHQKLALKKRVYEAGDWNGFRNAVNAHKSFGDYIVIKR